MNKDNFFDCIDRDRLYSTIKDKTTPCYLYFTDIVNRQASRVRECIGERFTLNYAVKANPHIDLLKELKQLNLGADVASKGELERTLAAGISPASIEFSGPGKSSDELAFAIESKIGAINVESHDEVESIISYCKNKNCTANVAVRINPKTTPAKTGLRMAGDTQFGIIESELPRVLSCIEDNSQYIIFQGIHVHTGSQILDSDIIIRNYEIILNEALALTEHSSMEIRKINFGGGWGIDYFPNQNPLDLKDLSEKLKNLFTIDKYKTIVEKCKLVVEPGRFLVAECGVFVTRVLSVKKSQTRYFAILDGGMHNNYLLAGGMGQVIQRNFEIDTYLKQQGEESKYTFAGPLCTPQDILGRDVSVRGKLTPGDYVIFFNCGAYGPSASPQRFLSHLDAREYIER